MYEIYWNCALVSSERNGEPLHIFSTQVHLLERWFLTHFFLCGPHLHSQNIWGLEGGAPLVKDKAINRILTMLRFFFFLLKPPIHFLVCGTPKIWTPG